MVERIISINFFFDLNKEIKIEITNKMSLVEDLMEELVVQMGKLKD
jgi:hypothetical protein